MHARRNQPTTLKLLANFEISEATISTGSRTTLRSTLGRSLKGHVRMGRKLKRSELYLRQRCRLQFLEGSRYRPHLQGASGRWGGLLVFCKETASYHIQRSQLLRGVRELRCSHERRLVTHVLLSNPQVLQKEKMITLKSKYNHFFHFLYTTDNWSVRDLNAPQRW